MNRGKILNWLIRMGVSMTVLMLIAASIPVFIADQFIVRGQSMEPTLYDGERILVNKLIAGARIYTNYDFSSNALECFRLPGTRRVRPGDIVVFNSPEGGAVDRIRFKINYVYAKRCVAGPGDSLSVVDGAYYNSNCREVPGMAQAPIRQVAEMPDSVLWTIRGCRTAPYCPEILWTIRHFGPMYIPKRGDDVVMNAENYHLYRKAIEYETGIMPELIDGQIMMGPVLLKSYCFKSNYYFFAGDNILNSRDSRYFGIVPEDYIIGVVTVM